MKLCHLLLQLPTSIIDRPTLDLHSDNLLVAIIDDSVLADVEEGEVLEPAARKQDDDRFIYVSRYMLAGAGPLTICDLGQARIGSKHTGPAMPLPYRAPEVILKMEWGSPVDLWAVGLLVRILGPPCLCGSPVILSLSNTSMGLGLESARACGPLRCLCYRFPRAQRCPPSRSHDCAPGSAAARVSQEK
jgi:hypothetical protein